MEYIDVDQNGDNLIVHLFNKFLKNYYNKIKMPCSLGSGVGKGLKCTKNLYTIPLVEDLYCV